ncbi:carboxymuconolactone decarboxylase family protein [Mesorhizobium sp. PL10]
MAMIAPIDYATASQDIRAEHDRELGLRGRMTNMKRILLHSPAAHRIYAEWFTLRDLLKPTLDGRAIWLLSLAISQGCRAEIPVTFFRRALIDGGLDPEAIGPSADEALLIEFGKALAASSDAIPDDIWAALRARYDDTLLVNLVAFAGIMVATCVFTNAVRVDLDPELEGYRKR